ncbi:hypothetical protein H7R39_00615 [Campylobacter sp. Marseille-Q3452]|uniref:Uncharacterized protein n=1 Tax=Campylobacter massiliensis TaxID=2762557 RepID=A0A842J9I4_9BACT|nr:hypothetical protein [Campylobacter massiliensis]MBC2881794.1 hypothetical protein [Campylobacter massiliensis]
MLPDVSAVTAAREKRRKFALRETKKAQARAHAAGRVNLSQARGAYPPCKFDGFGSARRLVKFALKFSSNLRLINLTEPWRVLVGAAL